MFVSSLFLAVSADAAPVRTTTEETTWSMVEPVVPDLPTSTGGEEWVPRIVNGEEVGITDFQEVVHLVISGPSGSGECTGSLITPNHVLTAAHCFDGVSPEKGGSVTVEFGNNTFVAGGVTQTIDADWWVVNEAWLGEELAGQGGNYQGDVAVAHLVRPVTDVQPMSLNMDPIDDTWIGLPVRLTGFGITSFQGTGSGIKRTTETLLSDYDEFQVMFFDGQGHSSCSGDSGGPGMISVGGGYVQISVVSHGLICGETPDEDMRVDTYIDWIREKVVPDVITTSPSAPPRFQCNQELAPGESETYALGIIPMDLKCVVDYYAPSEIEKVTWEWGDGTQDEVTAPPFTKIEHTYTDSGSHSLRMCVEGTRDTGPWSHCMRRFGYVRACGVPQAAFEVEPLDGTTVQFNNRSDVSDYGCISDIAWQVFKGSGTSGAPVTEIAAWEPQITFKEPGEYTAVLNVGGIGGTGAAKLTFDVKNQRSSGCDQSALGTLGLLGVLASAAATRRARR